MCVRNLRACRRVEAIQRMTHCCLSSSLSISLSEFWDKNGNTGRRYEWSRMDVDCATTCYCWFVSVQFPFISHPLHIRTLTHTHTHTFKHPIIMNRVGVDVRCFLEQTPSKSLFCELEQCEKKMRKETNKILVQDPFVGFAWCVLSSIEGETESVSLQKQRLKQKWMSGVVYWTHQASWLNVRARERGKTLVILIKMQLIAMEMCACTQTGCMFCRVCVCFMWKTFRMKTKAKR